MQVLTLIKAVSVAMAAGSLSFLMAEWRFYKNAFANTGRISGPGPDTGRLVRRTFGSAILLTMALCMFMGKLPEPGASPEEVLNLFYYWSAIVALALLLGLTALYDAVRGVKTLGNYVSVVESEELAALAKQLKDSPKVPHGAVEKD